MAELKTQKNDASIEDFLASVENPQQRKDAQALFAIFQQATIEPPSMWGTSIVGFGQYHYKSTRSTQEGDWPLTGFSPRKQNISIYIMPGVNKYSDLLKKLGKYKASKGSCLYIKKLSDIDTNVLKEIIRASVADMKRLYPEY